MFSRPKGTAWFLVSALVLGLASASGSQELVTPPTREQELWERAGRLWNVQMLEECMGCLKTFAQDYPHSHWAAEAAYKLACGELLQNHPKEARQAFDALVQDHFQTTWARLALQAHYDEGQLLELAKELRTKARQKTDAARALQALAVLKTRAARFPNVAGQVQGIYLAGDCYRLAGRPTEYQAAMQEVQKRDNGDWAKLAALRLGDQDTFRKQMDELIELSAPDREHLLLFQELAEKYGKQLPGGDQVKCQFLAARCLDAKQEMEVYRAIVKEHPQTAWAAESAFWLAERLFKDKQLPQAQAAYRELAKTYPSSPRAAQASRYADWIDQTEAICAELEKPFARLFGRLDSDRFSLGFNLAGESSKRKKAGQIRFCWQGAEQFLLEVHYGSFDCLLASNARGTWYHVLDNPCYVHAPGHLPLPIPRLALTVDRTTGAWNFTGNFSSESGLTAPDIKIDPAIAPLLARLILSSCHITREVRKNGQGQPQTVFVIQDPAWATEETWVLEGVVGPNGNFETIRLHRGAKGEYVTVTDIVVCNPLPDSAFEVAVPPGVKIKEVAQIPIFELYGQFMRLLGELGQDVQSEIANR
jgi:TolA-binding protein